MCAADDEHRIGPRRKDERDGSPEEPGLLGNDGECRTEAAGKKSVGGQWACERQPPPQQPPAAGAGTATCCVAEEPAGRAVSDMSLSTLPLPQAQVTAEVPRTSRSKRLPQALH